MSKHAKIGQAKWLPSKDLQTAAELCEHFNKGRTYEIFWEYCGLTADILKEKSARCWLYREDDEVSGFALGRPRDETFVFEEIWGPCDGISNELSRPSMRDVRRMLDFKKLLSSLDSKVPIMLRAATDNQFAHLIARALRASWMNGLIIAERTLSKKFEISTPMGYKLRMFRDSDQLYMSKIRKEAFGKVLSPDDYKAWATKKNCRTIMATCHEELVGFIIAEKRPCGSLGDFTIAVKPSHQRKGIGSTLLKAAFNVFIEMEAKRVIADYLMLNTPAHRLYQKHSFKPKRIYNYFLYER